MLLKYIPLYRDTGELCFEFFKDELNRYQGENKCYRKNGDIEVHSMWKDGKKHGEYICYLENGNVLYHHVYINGVLHAKYSDLTEMDKFELALKYGIEWLNKGE